MLPSPASGRFTDGRSDIRKFCDTYGPVRDYLAWSTGTITLHYRWYKTKCTEWPFLLKAENWIKGEVGGYKFSHKRRVLTICERKLNVGLVQATGNSGQPVGSHLHTTVKSGGGIVSVRGWDLVGICKSERIHTRGRRLQCKSTRRNYASRHMQI